LIPRPSTTFPGLTARERRHLRRKALELARTGRTIGPVMRYASPLAALLVVTTAPAQCPPAVKCWGLNNFGQCTVPADLGAVSAIAAGGYHTLAVVEFGTVRAWGWNIAGQCNPPVGLASVTAVAGGDLHSVALRSTGEVVCWGSNLDGQCAVPANLGAAIAIAAGKGHTVALRADGTVRAWGRNWAGQSTPPAGLRSVVEIACAAGGNDTLARRANGTVVAWGENGYGQSSVPAGLSGATAIGASVFRSIAVRTAGAVTCWGASGPVPPTSTWQAFAGGGDHLLGLRWNGTVSCYGYDADGQCSVPADLGNVRQVSAGWSHSVALRAFISGGGGSSLTCPYSQGDLDASGTIDGVDLAILLSLWGEVGPDIGDLNLDGQVEAGDLSILLGFWGLPPCFQGGC
jgi:hypothetical protein